MNNIFLCIAIYLGEANEYYKFQIITIITDIKIIE